MSSRKPTAKHNTPRYYYDKHDRLNGKSPATGKPYPTHTRRCLHCGEQFEVVHYPGMRWVHIKWCCRDCCWLDRYGRKYDLSPEEKAQHNAVVRKQQRISSWLRARTPDERCYFQHLMGQII